MTEVVYAIDVDGTVADNEHRVHLIRGENPDWDTFFQPSLMMKDTPIEAAKLHFRDGQFIYGRHFFLTARTRNTRRATYDWLVEHGFARSNIQIFCKPDYMHLMRARVFKPLALQSLAATQYAGCELRLIEDYGEVRRSVEEAGFRVYHAPDCWEDGSFDFG